MVVPEIEEPLFGGLVNGRVVKVGDTVRRPSHASTPTIHALLAHLRSKGFPCPAPLGIDGAGREVLSFIPGEASQHPWPPALLEISGARQVGAMLKAYHDAIVDFVPPSPIWRHGAQTLAPGEVVLHGDFGPHNLIWMEERLSGVIDFELARPGQPDEDALFAAVRVAHLRPDEMARAVGFKGVPDRRARLIAFAAGCSISPAKLLAGACAAQQAELERITRLGGASIEPWATFLRRGLDAQVRSELAWLAENVAAIQIV